MPKDRKEYYKQYRLKNKEKRNEYNRQYKTKNKDKLKQYDNEYHKTESFRKSKRITQWKSRGILCFDYNLLYDIFLSTNRCEYCDVLLQGVGKDCRCLDHDHSITDKFNIRGVLCKSCNNKDVLK